MAAVTQTKPIRVLVSSSVRTTRKRSRRSLPIGKRTANVWLLTGECSLPSERGLQ